MTTAEMALFPRLREALDPPAEHALRAAIAEAKSLDLPLYVVGGAVRDLLIGAGHVDLDLVVEGDALALSRGVAGRLAGRAVLHARFGTAVVSGTGFRLDIATARAETYARPGALPVVRPATLNDDLARRDFSINAMALRIAPRAGDIIDPFGGREDLDRRFVRVLHDRAFQDDATRTLRGIRYAGRFRFRIEPVTHRLLRRDLSHLAAISGARLRREIELIAAEDRVAEIVRLAERFGVWRAIDSALRAPDAAALRRFSKIPLAQRDDALVALLLARATPQACRRGIKRLSLARSQQDAVGGLRTLMGQHARLSKPDLKPSAATKLLATVSPSAVEAFAASEGRTLAARRARRYLDEWRYVRPRMNGHELIKMGMTPGPRVGEMLAGLRDARLDGSLRTKRAEVSFVRTRLARRSGVRAS
jgi:tRNA nucleotidyltransferase (CCA-adding enzyme)